MGLGPPEAFKIAFEVWTFGVLHPKDKICEMAQTTGRPS